MPCDAGEQSRRLSGRAELAKVLLSDSFICLVTVMPSTASGPMASAVTNLFPRPTMSTVPQSIDPSPRTVVFIPDFY